LNNLAASAVLLALLIGPLALAPLEHNLEPFCFALGLLAVTMAGRWDRYLATRVVLDPLPITLVVIAAGIVFGRMRHALDWVFIKLRTRMPRAMLTASAVVVIGLLSAYATALVAALILIEAVALIGLKPRQRIRVVVLGCYAIGMGSALTPLGGPLATLAAAAMNLSFGGLFWLLAPWVIPGIAVVGLVSGIVARGPYDPIPELKAAQEGPRDALFQGIKVFAFISGLIMIGAVCGPAASSYLAHLSDNALYWANTSSAALDNSTLVAIEFSRIDATRARTALISLLISGGMLIPGNVPNIVCAGRLRIGSGEWARTGLPFGALMLALYFGILWLI
jgi:predicted cation transporter